MNSNHPIDSLMQSTMENLKEMIDVNTVIGEPVITKDGCIIPISKVCLGFATGGSEFGSTGKKDKEKELELKSEYPFGGGSGAGVSIKPIAFLVIHKDSVRLLPVEASTPYDRIADNIPQVLDMISSYFSNDKCCKKTKTPSDSENE